MPALDLRILVVTPYALAVAVLLWILRNLMQESLKKKCHTPTRLLSISQAQAPGAVRVYNFPESGGAVPTARNSEPGTSTRPQPSGQASLVPQRLTSLPTR